MILPIFNKLAAFDYFPTFHLIDQYPAKVSSPLQIPSIQVSPLFTDHRRRRWYGTSRNIVDRGERP